MMDRFVYSTLPCRVLFGRGRRDELARELDVFGWRRALVVSTPDRAAAADDIARLIAPRAAGVLATAVMHVPVEVANAAVAEAQRVSADVVIAVGGGSTIGLAKAIALLIGLPVVALPTTYAGSEMTNLFGMTEGGVKRTGRDDRVNPKLVIYDAELSQDLPARMAVMTGMNALAHSVEAYYGPDTNPVIWSLADESLRILGAALPRIVADPADLDARQDAFAGAMIAGQILALAGFGLHHKLAHVLGGSFGMPHAETNTILLPHASAYNIAGAPEAFARVAAALGGDPHAPQAIWDLEGTLGVPRALRDIGFKAEDIGPAAEIACAATYPNPRPVEVRAITGLLWDAYEGRAPRRWGAQPGSATPERASLLGTG